MGRMQHIGLALAASVVLAAQAPVGPSYEDLCAAILQDRTEFMEECAAAQAESNYFVMDWFARYGLLTPEGEVDTFQLLEAQMDPTRAMYETPASTAAFCIETTGDWIGMPECLVLTEQDSFFMGSDPGLMGPDLGPEYGPDTEPSNFLEPGVN